MQYKNTLEAVYIQLNEILQNVANWGVDQPIRTIDVDLALSKIRNVYDSLLSLKEEQGNSVTLKADTAVEIIENIVEDSPKTHEPAPVEVPDVTPKTEETPTKETNKEETNKPITKKYHSTDNSSLSDKYLKSKPTLNEELSSQVASSDLANQLKNRPITNLSSAIGLNEKFELINTLFHGDKLKYEETIETLNKFANFSEAYNFISTVLKWNISDPSVQRVLELIRRKQIK
jgi:hypothetical protein